jgi:Protein similar to CwfJ C-terminus 2/Protein similar to CwfJ C-terminus 1
MLKGIKTKPKNPTSSTQKKSEDIPENKKDSQEVYRQGLESEINELAKIEKNVKTKDLDLNFVKNLKHTRDSEYLEEIEKYSVDQIGKFKQPVTLKSINCQHCIGSLEFPSELLLSLEDSVHISLPLQGPLVPGHCIISPNTHVLASTELDSNEFEDLQNAKQKISKFYLEEYGKKGIFIEYLHRIEDYNHIFIDSFPVSLDILDDCYNTVLRELNEADDEWTDNKKIIKVGSQGIQAAIPKGFPYVYFDFNSEKGLAHVIENHRRFKKDFTINMLAEALGIDILYTRKKISRPSLLLAHKEFYRKFNRSPN